MKNIKLVVHDWDDTITPSFETYIPYFFDFAKYFELAPPEIENIKEYWGDTLESIIEGIWPDTLKTGIASMIETFSELFISNYSLSVFPGVKKTFRSLTKKGYDLGILTSGSKKRVMKIYAENINKKISYHKFIVDKKDCEFHKPDPRVFDTVLDYYEKPVDESQILYVGDSLIDYKTAKSRKIKFIAVTSGVHSPENFLEEGLKKNSILNSFTELDKLL